MNLLEREQCLSDLKAWLETAAESGGCIALVGGEAGIGKTALLQQFGSEQHDVRVLWGGCDDLFTPRPLAPLHDIARQVQGALHAALGSGASRDDIFNLALDELEAKPTLAVFEDLHWADEATLDLLKFLGRRIHRTRSMIAVSYRADEVGPRHPLRMVMGDLPRSSTRRMLVAPLSESAVAQLACRAGRRPEGLYGITAGNPLFLTEVLATGADTVPATVRDAVLARAARLTPAARNLAELVCVVPGKAEIWLLEQAVHLDDAGIEECLGIGMMLSEDGSLGYRHELVRRAFEDSLPPPRKRDLHAKVLAVLAARPGVPPARLAHHASSARDLDAVMRFAALAAAQATSVGAHREARAHFETMMPYAGNLAPADRARLLEQLSYERYLTGQYGGAGEARREALTIWRALGARTQEGDTLRSLSKLAWAEGRRRDADHYCTEAVKVLETLPAGDELALAYRARADLDMEAHRNDSAIVHAQRAIALAESLSNDLTVSYALNTLGTARLIVGDDSGWADLDRSLQLALAGGFQEQVATAYTALSAMAVSRRQYNQAASYLGAGLAYCEERDLDFLRPYMLAYRGRMRLELGDWVGAAEDAGAVLSDSQTPPVARLPALRVLGQVRIRRGDPEASAPLEEATALAGAAPELQQFGSLAAIRAEAAWLAGDREGVMREAQPAYERVSQHRDPRMKGELAAWLRRVEALDGVPTEVAEPYAMELLGDWRGAALAWQGFGCPYEHAIVLGRYGGEVEQREALSILDALGAAPAAEAVRRQMRAQGVRGIPRGSRASTRSHAYGLTQREAEVLALLSEGLRNSLIAKRLFVSTKTIDHHVSAILMKLGVPSRAQAVAMTRQQHGKGG
jgi:DNA-binding CsgD family transcriptional regulator/tetratricopeptide (TPR) repeat protein